MLLNNKFNIYLRCLDEWLQVCLPEMFSRQVLQVSHSAVQTLPSLFLSLGRQIERERGFEEVKFSKIQNPRICVGIFGKAPLHFPEIQKTPNLMNSKEMTLASQVMKVLLMKTADTNK